MAEAIKGTISSSDSGDYNDREIKIDTITRAVSTIEYEHHEIHGGNHFYADFTSGTLNATVIYNVILRTGPSTTKLSHMVFESYAPLGMTVDIFEGSTYSAGTACTVYNNYRASTKVSALTVSCSATTAAVGGTNIKSRKAGSATVANKTEGEVRSHKELMLKAATTYVARYTSNVNSNYVSGSLEWYDHTNLA